MLKIAVDIDEVIADFMTSLVAFHNEEYHTSFQLDDFVSYDFHRVWGGEQREANIKMHRFFSSSYFTNMRPLPGAKEALSTLCDRHGYELHAVTSRLHSLEADTRLWLDTHFPHLFSGVHFGSMYATDGSSRKKSDICRDIGACLLIDDSPHHAVDCSGAGLPFILFGEYPWNLPSRSRDPDAQCLSGVRRVYKWNDETVKTIVQTAEATCLRNQDVVTIAIVQMCACGDKEVNYATCERLIREACTGSPSALPVLICLPECFSYIGETGAESIAAAEDPATSTILSRYASLAKELRIWLSLGGFPERRVVEDQVKLSNLHVIVSPNGVIDHRYFYRKIHLFDAPCAGLYESSTTVPGTELVVVDMGFARVGLSICFDIRFPLMFEQLRHRQDLRADIILVPSAFTVKTGHAHWEILLRARAIETQCMLVAAAQSGVHNSKRQSYGHSIAVDAWGRVVAYCGAEENGITYAFFDRAQQNEIRSGMPVQDMHNY